MAGTRGYQGGDRLLPGELASNVASGIELIKIIELEISGIRDGDGYWHGSDPLWHTVHDITEAFKRATNEKEVSGLDPTTKN
jgi:hypothetical protein